MTDNDWTTQLRDRLAEHEMPAPDGLWDDIEAKLTAPAPQQSSRSARVISPRRWATILHRRTTTPQRRSITPQRWAIAAAIAALIIGGTYLLWFPQLQPSTPTIAQASTTPSAETTATPAAPSAETALAAAIPSAGAAATSATPSSGTTLAAATPNAGTTQASAIPSAEPAATSAAHNAETTQASATPNAEAAATPSAPSAAFSAGNGSAVAPPATALPRKKVPQAPTLQLFATAGATPQDNANGVLMSPTQASLYNSMAEQRQLMARAKSQPAIYLANYEERQHHDQPFSLGLTASYPLSPHWSLSTGLVYTRLHSTFTSITGITSFSKDQTLHYLGLPLNVQYHFWHIRQLQAYAAAGMQLDKNVSAKVSTNGTQQSTSRDRLQWSVQGMLGAQLNVTPQLAIYAEPGVKYYFDNHSPLQNYFKDKPLEFNLQLGLRLNLGQ